MMQSFDTNANEPSSEKISSVEPIPDSNEVQAVKQLLDAIATGDRETFLELQTPAVLWEVDGNVAPVAPNTTQTVDIIPFAGTWFAPEGANLINRTTADFFENFQESLEISKLEPLEFFQDDDKVIARANLEAVVPETDLPFDVDVVFIIDLEESEDGSVQIDNVRMKYHSLTVARAFSGLTPPPEFVDNAAKDPLTGEPQSNNPNADSEESLRVVQNAFADFLAGDFVKFSEAFAEDAVIVFGSDPAFLPQSGVWEGPQGVIEALTTDFLLRFTSTVFVPKFIANGDRVAITSEAMGFYNENNFNFDDDGAQFLTIENGLITNWQVVLNDYTSASAVAGEPLFLDSESPVVAPSLPDSDVDSESPILAPNPLDSEVDSESPVVTPNPLDSNLDSESPVVTPNSSDSDEVEIVKQLLDAMATGDRETFLELQTPAVLWEVDGNVAPIAPNTTQTVDIIPFAGTWFAPEGANLINRTTADFFENFQESLEILKLEPLEFFQDDDRVIARVNLEAVVEETGLPFDVDLAYIIDFEESEDGSVQIDNVQIHYHSLTVARAFSGLTPSLEFADNAARDPLTGELQSFDPNADSEESLRVAQNAYADFLAGDIATFSQAFAEDAVVVIGSDPEFLPQSGVWEGPEGVVEALGVRGLLAFTPTVFVPKFTANGNRVVVTSEQEGLTNDNNLNFDTDGVQLLTIEDGLITSWQILLNDYTSASAVAGEPLFLDNELPTSEPTPDNSEQSNLIFGNNGDDTLEIGLDIKSEQNFIFSGAGDDLVDASQAAIGNNKIFGGTGLDELFAGKNDRIFGGVGDDILDASAGTGGNRLYGGYDNDELFAGTNDRLFAGEGDDILDATTGTGGNRLYGQAGNDTFFLGSGDRLLGGDGDDAFFVTDGSDNLITGGKGADAFWIATGEFITTANRITDFDLDGDVIGVAGLGATSIDDLVLEQVDNDAIISFAGFDLALLQNIQVNDLQANGTFVFA